jgi:hypothetical protein
MAKIKFHKVQNELPPVLDSNSIYFVEKLGGFDLYVTSLDVEPVARKINPGDYTETSISILLANSGNQQINLSILKPNIEEKIEITYHAKRQTLVESGTLKILSSKPAIYRESEYDEVGITFNKTLVEDHIILNIGDNLENGNSTIVKFNIKTYYLNF